MWVKNQNDLFCHCWKVLFESCVSSMAFIPSLRTAYHITQDEILIRQTLISATMKKWWNRKKALIKPNWAFTFPVMDYLASAISKSVAAIFHTAAVNGQQIVSCDGRKTHPAVPSYSNGVQTAEIMEKEMANTDCWNKLNKTPVNPLSLFALTFDTLWLSFCCH